MNIFVLDTNPQIAATMHADRHVVKMVLETAQMLCTAHHTHGNADAPYKPAYMHHPCTKWVSSTSGNYWWAFNLFLELLDEYTHRYSKTHSCSRLVEYLRETPAGIVKADQSDFALAMPDQYKQSDAVLAYRDYYINEKKHLLQYTHRTQPTWITEALHNT